MVQQIFHGNDINRFDFKADIAYADLKNKFIDKR